MRQNTIFLAVMFACAHAGEESKRRRLRDWLTAGDNPGIKFAQMERWRQSVHEAMGVKHDDNRVAAG